MKESVRKLLNNNGDIHMLQKVINIFVAVMQLLLIFQFQDVLHLGLQRELFPRNVSKQFNFGIFPDIAVARPRADKQTRELISRDKRFESLPLEPQFFSDTGLYDHKVFLMIY